MSILTPTLHRLALTLLIATGSLAHADRLPSWSEGAAKSSILQFVSRVDAAGIPKPERIAVFDNDGTLWNEQPFYIEGAFTTDRVKALAPEHPEWKRKMPFKAVLEDDYAAMSKFTKEDFGTLVAATHSGMTTEEFKLIVQTWLKTATHPRFKRLYKTCVYQPMLEVLRLLRAHGFKTYIVTGGGLDFVRAFAEEVYGVPPEQVIGSSGVNTFELLDGKGFLLKTPKFNSLNDGPEKPVNIGLHIGRRPLFAFGNSDGDLQMLQYTDMNQPTNLMLLVHHDDRVREYAYDRHSAIGKLDKAWDEALARHWQVVSMKDDFKTIFPPTSGEVSRAVK